MSKKKVAKKKVAKKKVSKKKVAKAKPILSEIDRVSCERELRKYVRRDGGYAKGITGDDRKRAKVLLKLLGRKELVWDDKILSVPQKSILV